MWAVRAVIYIYIFLWLFLLSISKFVGEGRGRFFFCLGSLAFCLRWSEDRNSTPVPNCSCSVNLVFSTLCFRKQIWNPTIRCWESVRVARIDLLVGRNLVNTSLALLMICVHTSLHTSIRVSLQQLCSACWLIISSWEIKIHIYPTDKTAECISLACGFQNLVLALLHTFCFIPGNRHSLRDLAAITVNLLGFILISKQRPYGAQAPSSILMSSLIRSAKTTGSTDLNWKMRRLLSFRMCHAI